MTPEEHVARIWEELPWLGVSDATHRLLQERVRDAIEQAVKDALEEDRRARPVLPGAPMGEAELADARRVLEGCTEGPWGVGEEHDPDGLPILAIRGPDPQTPLVADVNPAPPHPGHGASGCGGNPQANATLIAGSRTLIPALLAHIDHLHAILHDAQQESGWADGYDRGRRDALAALEALWREENFTAAGNLERFKEAIRGRKP